jgi:hypothetical protein
MEVGVDRCCDRCSTAFFAGAVSVGRPIVGSRTPAGRAGDRNSSGSDLHTLSDAHTCTDLYCATDVYAVSDVNIDKYLDGHPEADEYADVDESTNENADQGANKGNDQDADNGADQDTAGYANRRCNRNTGVLGWDR